MPEVNFNKVVLDAFDLLFHLPVLGIVAQEIWNALGIDPIAGSILAGLSDKAALTSLDGQLHSFMMIFPTPPGWTTIVVGLTWPNGISESRQSATEQFFTVANKFIEQDGVAGVLQLDVFLGERTAAKLRLAWMPFATAPLAKSLRKTLLPWGTEPRSKEDVSTEVGGKEIVALAEAAWDLTVAMRDRLSAWPNENGPTSPSFSEVRDRFKSLVPKFNEEAQRVGLGHAMPVSDFDHTWLPHNLANALHFGSLEASLKAELLRVWGPDGRDRFVEAWKLFADSIERPSEAALARINEPLLRREPASAPAIPEKNVDVFISYAWSDKTRGARDIYELMIASGHSAWMDEERRLGDAGLNDQIAKAMLRCGRIVICLSREMLTRGGYALREVLLAVVSIPGRCLVVRLDRIPIPTVLAGIGFVNWFEPTGRNELLAALGQTMPREASGNSVDTLSLEGPLIDKLVASLARQDMQRRRFDTADRKGELALRANLYSAASAIMGLLHEENIAGALAAVGESSTLVHWSELTGTSAETDPTVLGGSLRLRSGLFRAHIRAGAKSECKVHNCRAFELLGEILTIDFELLRPAPEFGWPAEDCRLAVQDCLDTCDVAREWFRGWSPDLLVRACGVRADAAACVEDRIESRLVLLGDRMLALRAWEERASVEEPAPSWSMVWSSVVGEIRRKLQVGAHPGTKAYFEELGRWLSRPIVEQIAAAIADGVIESRLERSYREELAFELTGFGLRCVVRCYRAQGTKRDSLRSVRGTVLSDLDGGPSGGADLNILLSQFAHWDPTGHIWRYNLFLNSAPSSRRENAERIPRILRNTFTVAEMLDEEERGRISRNDSNEIYEEL